MKITKTKSGKNKALYDIAYNVWGLFPDTKIALDTAEAVSKADIEPSNFIYTNIL